MTVVAEGDVVACVERLHKVVFTVPAAPALMDALADVLPALFDLYCAALQSLSHLSTACEVCERFGCIVWKRGGE